MTYDLLYLPKEGESKVAAIDIPNVLYHRKGSIFYFRGMPSCGAYFALPITLASGEVVGFIAADTLLEKVLRCARSSPLFALVVVVPSAEVRLSIPQGTGSGRPLSVADKDYITKAVTAVADAMNRADAERQAAMAEVRRDGREEGERRGERTWEGEEGGERGHGRSPAPPVGLPLRLSRARSPAGGCCGGGPPGGGSRGRCRWAGGGRAAGR